MDEPPTGVDLALVGRVDEACLHFEDQWKAGLCPDPGPVLDDFPESARGDLLAELLLLEWDYRSRRGGALDPHEHARRFPARAAVVEQTWQRHLNRQGEGSTTPP